MEYAFFKKKIIPTHLYKSSEKSVIHPQTLKASIMSP